MVILIMNIKIIIFIISIRLTIIIVIITADSRLPEDASGTGPTSPVSIREECLQGMPELLQHRGGPGPSLLAVAILC